MAKAKGKNRFVVDLGGMSLSADDRRGVAAAIQGAVLSFLAVNTKMPGEQVTLIDEGGIEGMFLPDKPYPPSPPPKKPGR